MISQYRTVDLVFLAYLFVLESLNTEEDQGEAE